jgi:hypothetical protein
MKSTTIFIVSGIFLASALVVGLFGVPAIVSASPSCSKDSNGPYPAQVGNITLTQDSNVTVTYNGGCTAWNDDFGYHTSNNVTSILLGSAHTTPVGTVFNIGHFSAGTSLFFSINQNGSGNVWFNGPGSVNADGMVHADVEPVGTTQWNLFFEDLSKNQLFAGEPDYNDVMLTVTATPAVVTSPNLVISCSASPNPANTNQQVAFNPSVTGGNGTYAYQWSGSCTATSQSCFYTFGQSGAYNESLTVTSGTQSANTSCSVSVSQACTPNTTQKCVGNSVYNFDSCNVQGSLVQTCNSNQTCSNGSCMAVTCSNNSDCGTNGITGSQFCGTNNSIYQTYRTYTCINAGTSSSYCSNSTTNQQQQSCGYNQTCNNGSCTNTYVPPVNNCTYHAYTRCSGNGVYWFDSCGVQEDLYQSCQYNQTCQNNSCTNTYIYNPPVNNCSYHSYLRCSGNSLYWYDSCGAQQDFYQACTGNQTCQNNTCVTNIQNNQTALTITKTVRNLSTGNLTWANSVYASPGDIVQFQVTVQSTNQSIYNNYANNVVIRDTFPNNLTYSNNLILDGTSNSGNIVSGLNIGSLSNGQTRTITYQAQVAQAQQFSFGTSTLNNSVSVAADSGYSPATASASVIVTRTGIHGATTVSTGLTNNFLLDSFFLPLMAALGGVWLWRSGAFGLTEWIDTKRTKYLSFNAKKKLERKIKKLHQSR